jgi:hypothetical protein
MARLTKRTRRIIEAYERLGDKIALQLQFPEYAAIWAFYKKRLVKIDKILVKMKEIWNRYVPKEVPVHYAAGAKRVEKLLAKFKRRGKTYQSKAIRNLENDMILDMFEGLAAGRRDIERYFRLAQAQGIQQAKVNEAIARGLVEGTPKAVKSELLVYLEKTLVKENKLITVIGKTRRKYKPEYYAEMVARTRLREANSLGVIQTSLDYGVDTIQVSSHNTETPICLEYEGQIYSISGTSKEFPPLPAYAPFHPNCLHVMAPIVLSPADTKRGMQQRAIVKEYKARNEKLLKEQEKKKAEK